MRQIAALLGLLLSTATILAEDYTIDVIQPFTGASLLVDTTNYSKALDLNTYKPHDFKFALQIQATNLTVGTAGVVELSYELSNNNVDYMSNSVIVSGFSYTNSPTDGGKGFYQFETGKARYMRLKAILSQTNSWLTGWLAIQ